MDDDRRRGETQASVAQTRLEPTVPEMLSLESCPAVERACFRWGIAIVAGLYEPAPEVETVGTALKLQDVIAVSSWVSSIDSE